MIWNDEKSVDIIRQTLRNITDNLTTVTGVEAYNRSFQLNNKGLRQYVETKLPKKIFVELFNQLIQIT